MKKRIIRTAFALASVLALTPSIKSYAWGGYAHWKIGNRFAKERSMDNKEKLYFTSGNIIADIGRLSWDSKYISSDSKEFTDKITELTYRDNFSTSSHKKFAEGWKAHYIQDNEGTPLNIVGGPDKYRIKCGWIDEYLRDKEKIKTPINGKADMVIDYDLIRAAYEELCSFEPTNTEINTQVKVIFIAYDLQILINRSGWTSEDMNSIELGISKANELCNKHLYDKGNSNKSKILTLASDSGQTARNTPEELIQKIITSKIHQLESEDIVEYVTNSEIDDNHFRIIIKDEMKYNEALLAIMKELNEYFDFNSLF